MSEDDGAHGGPRGREAARGVPDAVVVAASWSWRLVFIAAALYVLAKILAMLGLLVLSVIAAVLLTALLRPVAARLGRHLPGPLSAALTLAGAVAVIGGVGYFVVLRAAQDAPRLVDQFVATAQEIRQKLADLRTGSTQLDQLTNAVTDWLQKHRSSVVDVLTTGAGYTAQAITGLVLTVFITFFLLYQGEPIWKWLVSPFGARVRARVDRAGRVAWESTTGYVHGTVAIATIHGLVIGIALVILGTPLAAVLGVLVFFGSFIPLIGALVAGGLCVLVTLTTGGWIPALILFAILIVENQLEAHIYQPLIMGHSVRLHPLAIGLVITAGTLLAGIVGALIAVPLAAIIHRAAPELLRHRDPPREAEPHPGATD